MPWYNPLSWRRAEPPPPPPVPQNAAGRIGNILKTDLKDYWVDPVNKVMDEPIKALGYSGIIKTISLFIALIFPFLGYATLGVSIALIDRVIILNLRDFSNGVIDSINVECVQNLMRAVLGGRRDGDAPAGGVPRPVPAAARG